MIAIVTDFVFLCSAFLSSILLEERLNLHGKVGSLLSLLGSTVIVINAPDEQEVITMEEIQQRTANPGKYGVNLLYTVFVQQYRWSQPGLVQISKSQGYQ